MTELQECEYKILCKTIEVCNLLGLKYYLVCGSALGAVKYNGFIPWDDDVDIALPRKDYERLCREGQTLLGEKYFIQTADTDKMFPRISGKIRDVNTTYIEKTVSSLDINHGVYIDIFPLDEYPKLKLQQLHLEIKKWIYHHQAACVYAEPRKGLSELYRRLNILLGYDRKTNQRVKLLEKSLTQFRGKKDDVLCNHGNWQGKLDYSLKEQYGDGTWAVFEGIKVRIPKKYDEYFTQKYGDWRADLPKKQQVGHHYAEIIDLNRPYSDYIVKIGNGKIRLKTSSELAEEGIPPP
jgi:lipopolysaccharide cholinephosphotransferase